MPPVVLGLDIGGANLKAATADKRAVSVPFPLWKQPDRLPTALAELVGQFPDAEEFAVTMTGELCDCYETKRQGVNAILTAVQNVSRSYPIRVWGTDGKFLNVEEARTAYLKVAAANWHSLATFAGRYVPRGSGLLIDIGSTTTDLIPIRDGTPHPAGTTDPERLGQYQLVYTGVRRSPVCTLIGPREVAAELFASTLDAYLLLGHIAEDPNDCETCDGRPATKPHAHARMSRMLCGDPEMVPQAETLSLAERVFDRQRDVIEHPLLCQLIQLSGPRLEAADRRKVAILSGSGEFLARRLLAECELSFDEIISLTDKLGPAVAACAPAYALAVLATERRP